MSSSKILSGVCTETGRKQNHLEQEIVLTAR